MPSYSLASFHAISGISLLKENELDELDLSDSVTGANLSCGITGASGYRHPSITPVKNTINIRSDTKNVILFFKYHLLFQSEVFT